MLRPTQQQIDDGIADTAARLFAQHGYEQTSLQRIADEVGYSKTGLLHRFSSKEAIKEAVRETTQAHIATVIAAAHSQRSRQSRERAAVATMVDIAMDRPGALDLLLTAGLREPTEDTAWIHEISVTILGEIFGVTDGTTTQRQVQVIGALGALGVATSAMRDHPVHEVRPAVVATVCAALGHEESGSGGSRR